jgi:glycosyltransferase involved in cell wall biosynthesis
MDKAFSKMRIAIIGTRGIPASYGGFETFAEEISWRLASESFDVTVVCQASDIRKGFYGETKLRYSRFSKEKKPVRFYFDSLKIASANADIILVCGVGGAIFYPFLKRKKIKIITHTDGREELRGKYSAIKKLYVRICQFFTAGYSDHIITDSHAVWKIWREKYKIPRSKISSIEFGAHLLKGDVTHLTEMNLMEGGYYLVVCRMVPENNPDMIIKGFIASGSDKKLVLVGDVPGKYADTLLRHASHKIIFLNSIYDKIKLATLRRNCFAYIHGHTVGGTNPSLLEAMDAENVCICHDNVFNRETTENGMIYFGNTNELSSKIQLVENMDDEERKEMATKGKERILSYYNWENITKKYTHLFNSLIQSNQEFDIAIGRIENSDKVKYLAKFLRNEYPVGEISNEEYLSWEYLHNPSGKAIVTIAQKKLEIVSQYALAPVSIQENNNSHSATLSLNTLTAKRYRGQGLFLSTANDAFKYCTEKGIAFTYGVPNGNSFPGFTKRLDFTHAGDLVFMAKPLNPYRLIFSLFNRNKNKKGNSIRFIPDYNLFTQSAISDLSFPADEKNYDNFLRQWSSNGFISVHRTSEYMTWRYVQNPMRDYKLWKLVDGGEIKAIVVIRTMYLFGLKVCLIMDHFAIDNSHSLKMLNAVAVQAKLNELDLIIAVAASKRNNQFRQLLNSGFKHVPAFLLPQRLPFITRIHNDHDYWQKKLNNLRNWHFSFGDYDVF